MSFDSFASRVPLFLPVTDLLNQPIHVDELEQQTITIPVSYTLLEVLAHASIKEGSVKHVHAFLDEVMKNPSYFFPDVPLLFDREFGGLSLFVPDDGQEHILNWRALILEFHLGILSALGWNDISKTKKQVSFTNAEESILHRPAGDQVGSRTNQGGKSFNPGSLSLRNQNRCVGSFSNSRSTIGSMKMSFDNIQYEVAPPINRQESTQAIKDISSLNLEVNPLFNASITPSFENSLFKALILSVFSRGLYDKALGNLILNEFTTEFGEANIKLGKTVDSSSVFEGYYTNILRTLLPPEDEKEIRENLIADNVGAVLSKLDSLVPFDCLPHSRNFYEAILAPICYHENAQYASRAEKLYTMLINGHGWDIHSTEITTADQELQFEKIPDYVVLVSAPLGDKSAFAVLTTNSYKAFYSGYYDYCYAKPSSMGDYEIDNNRPIGRYIVLPAGARKEIIHELPAFDDKGVIKFEELGKNLETLANAGVTAVHITGVIERNFLHDLTSVTDHSLISEECGGIEAFKDLCERAKTYGLRVLIDFTPCVCLLNSAKKYAPFTTLTIDKRGRLLTADIPETEMLLLNYRSLKFWDLLAEEITNLCQTCDISGFYFGPLSHWDTVLSRNLKELTRNDPDHTPHYTVQNIIDGSIVSTRKNAPRCGMAERNFSYSPFLSKLMRTVWSKVPNAFVWMQCEVEQEPFVANSGIIPSNYAFRNVFQAAIEHSVHNDNVDSVNANEELIKFYDARKKRNPKGTLNIVPFGALMDGPHNIPAEGLPIAIDLLFYLSDVPLISGCLDTAMFYVNAYSMFKQATEETYIEVSDDDETLEEEEVMELSIKEQEQKKKLLAKEAAASAEKGTEKTIEKQKKLKRVKRKVLRGTKWFPPAQRFSSLLKNRAGTRTKADWVLDGDLHILPVSYDSHPMRAILAVARISKRAHKCALICSSFYMYNLIYEVGVLSLPIFADAPPESVVEIKPLIGASGQAQYYGLNEVTQNSSSLFLDLEKFETSLYEINVLTPPIPPNIGRQLVGDVYRRLENAINYNSTTVLANNTIFNTILGFIDKEPDDEQLKNLISILPNSETIYAILRQSLVFATRNKKVDRHLVKITDEKEVMAREQLALRIIHRIAESKLSYIADIGVRILSDNLLGPIMFVTPELGPFSKIGGISTMVWDLCKELAALGLDVHVVSPYYNVNNKGETGYLKKYGIEFVQTIDVYVPEQTKIGIHYGLVEGVKCWFLHHYSYFAVAYPTGSTTFKLQLLVVIAKASLEMCCQVRVYPRLFVTNDWPTGLVPAIARKQFGSVFDNSLFLHIFHNLGVGYAGKIWPNNGDTGSLRYIHQLPDELIVDNFDHSIDPSQCVLLSTDQWATVSKKYRDELLEGSPYSWLLKRYPEPFAYSNGIRFGERLEQIKKLGMNHDEAKRVVQQKYFGQADDSKCLFIFVGRIVEQKGVHLIIDCFEALNREYNDKFQFIVGGQAYPDDRSYGLPCSQKMVDLKQRYPKNFWADPSQFFTDGLLCYQAADYTLVPSMFEPSGIVQLEAFASGCPCIAFRTGGLADTVFEYDREKKTGNGFVFWSFQHRDYIMAIQRAYEVFVDKPNYWKLRENAFNSVLTVEEVAVQWSREFARMFLKIFEKKEPETEQKK